MGANRGASLNRNHRKKKKKNKKSKHKVLEARRATNLVINQAKTTGKIPDLIRETLAHISREKIVQLLFQVKERADQCYDFDISFWLQKFLELGDDVNLIEAAYLIVNAGHIYERKVDLLYELVRRSAESAKEASESEEKKLQSAPKPRRKITRQAVSVHDRLYESEMITKQFKQMPSERITELSTAWHKAPSHYFKKWAEYKLWRQTHKKKMRNPVPYSTVCDDLYLHPAMWGLSCVEDFDYDDDLDTKRNYRMFTHHMEHRYNTIVPDINFIMHFKVKDYIEAEEDEIEMKRILDLPTPPSRQWPPFCKTSYSRELAKEAFNIDIGESAEDYVKKYVDLEDIVLEKQTYEIDSDLLRNAKEAQKNNKTVTVSKESAQQIIFEELKKIMLANTFKRDLSKTNGTRSKENNDNGINDIGCENNAAELLTNTVTAIDGGNAGEVVEQQHVHDDVIVVIEESEAKNISGDNGNENPLEPESQEFSLVDIVDNNVDSMLSVENKNESKGGTLIDPNVASTGESSVTPPVEAHATIEPNSPSNASQRDGSSLLQAGNDIVDRIAADLVKALNSNSPVNVTSSSPKSKASARSSQTPNVIIESVEVLDPLNLQSKESDSGENPHSLENPSVETTNITLTNNQEVVAVTDNAVPSDAIVTSNSALTLFNKDASSIISDSIKNNISDQIVIRVSIDEGIAFSELDDLDQAMLSPVVELVDIFNPMKQELPICNESRLIVKSAGFRNILGIDERYLTYQADFTLPLEYIYKEPTLQMNFLELPEIRLKRKVNFALPPEYHVYMANRLKRKGCDKNIYGPTRMIKIFKLNDQNLKNVPITPPSTPNREEEFLGFDEIELSFDNMLSSTLISQYGLSKLLSSTTNRSISRDSGIGLSSINDSLILNSTMQECDETIQPTIVDGTNASQITMALDSGLNASTKVVNPAILDSTESGKGEQMIEILEHWDENGERPLTPTTNLESCSNTETNPNATVPSESSDSTPGPSKSPVDGSGKGQATFDSNESVAIDLLPNESDKIGSSDNRAVSASDSNKPAQKPKPVNPTKKNSSVENLDFEQNLYEKCANNDKIEKRVSEVNLMTERIQKWHRYLRPILAKSMERHHFDIFGIGTNIINTFQPEEISKNCPPVISLENVMENRDPTFLSRYFLSMLQLANAGNVEIKVQQRDINKPTPLGDIHLKLLSRKRHSVAVEDDIGARLLPSRKRTHSISDDSDSESASENAIPLRDLEVPSRSEKQYSSPKSSKLLKLQSAVSPQTLNSTNRLTPTCNIREVPSTSVRDFRNLSACKTSTPCTLVPKILPASNTQSNPRSKGFSSPSSASVNQQAFAENNVEAAPNVRAPTVRPEVFASNCYVNKKNNSAVSNNAIISIYKNKVDCSGNNSNSSGSNNLLNSSKNQEALSRTITGSQRSPSSELPPFNTIRRFDKSNKSPQNYQEISKSYESPKNMFASVESFNVPLSSNRFSQTQESTSSMAVSPNLIRTQESMYGVKKLRLNNDDLDSGIFSEFSISENNSTIRDS